MNELLKEKLLPGLKLDMPNFFATVFDDVVEVNSLPETDFGLCQEGGYILV